MGYLTTFTVYNDYCEEINKNPKEFAEEIFAACCNPNTNRKSRVFRGIVTAQKSRHADENTIYVHAGNTVIEVNAHSKDTKNLMETSPEFFDKILSVLEYNAKELKKMRKESKLKNK